MTTSVLITGGAGFIGRALATRLLTAGAAVTVLDNLHPQVHATRTRPVDLPVDVRLLVDDVTDPGAVESALALSDPDTVVHLAAETGTAQSLRAATRHGLVNVVGTTCLVDAMSARMLPPTHIVLASSRAVYGEGLWRDTCGTRFAPGPRRIEDLRAGRWDPRGPTGASSSPEPHCASTTPTMPVSVYGATKLAQELVLRAWCTASEVPLSVLRLQNVYGPGQSSTNPYAGVLGTFTRTAAAGENIDVFEDGGIRRDFVHVDDVVTALAAAVDRPPAELRTVDIGGGGSCSLLDVATTISTIAGAPPPYISGRFRAGDVRAASGDLGAATMELDFRTTWTLPRGLESLVHDAAARPSLPVA